MEKLSFTMDTYKRETDHYSKHNFEQLSTMTSFTSSTNAVVIKRSRRSR
jgi:hypothetical protein